MFGKLLKYEFKSVGKWYLGLYGAVALLSVIIGFWLQTIAVRTEQNNSIFIDNGYASPNSESIFFVFTMFAFGIFISALLISTFFLIVTRFKNNIYGRQGYLTMTLPVTSHQLILSKFLAALIWYLLAILMLVVSVAIIVTIAILPKWGEIPWEILFNSIFNFIGWGTLGQLSLTSFISIITSILLAYFSISLGQLFNDRRVLLAVVFYIGINFLVSMLTSIFFSTTGTGVSNSLLMVTPTTAKVTFDLNPIMMIINIVQALLYYFGTHYIMTKRLNIQ